MYVENQQPLSNVIYAKELVWHMKVFFIYVSLYISATPLPLTNPLIKYSF